MRETGMVIECGTRKHKFLLGKTDDGYGYECPICSKPLLKPRTAYNANEIYGMKTIGEAWRGKFQYERQKRNEYKSHRQNFYAVVNYVKELEMLLLHHGIPLPSTTEELDLPTRLEGSD